MNVLLPSETFLAVDPDIMLLVLAVLVIVIYVGRFLLNLAWSLIVMLITVVVSFYAVAIVLSMLSLVFMLV